MKFSKFYAFDKKIEEINIFRLNYLKNIEVLKTLHFKYFTL